MTTNMGNNFYQSLTVEPAVSEYASINNSINVRNISQSKETSPQSEYDIIPTNFSSENKSSTITDNSLYASKGDTLRHPVLKQGQQLDYYQLAPVPESIFSVQDDKSSKGKCCKCSIDAMLFLLSVLTILLSVMAITMVILIQFGIISSQISLTSNQPITDLSIPSPSRSSSNNVLPTSFPSPLPPTTTGCDCPNRTVPDPSIDFDDYYDSISIMMEGIEQLKQNKNISVSERMQILSDYLTQIKAINNSLQQLRPVANRPRQPILTGLNLTANIRGVVMNEGCVTASEVSCTISQAVGLKTCFTAKKSFINNNGMALVDYNCNVTELNNDDIDGPPSQIGASKIITYTSLSNESLFSNISGNFRTTDIHCRCFNFGTGHVDCGFIYTYCPVSVITRTETFQILEQS